ncbi:MAG: O-antigen ligase family protein [Bacteroidales bacterium]
MGIYPLKAANNQFVNAKGLAFMLNLLILRICFPLLEYLLIVYCLVLSPALLFIYSKNFKSQKSRLISKELILPLLLVLQFIFTVLSFGVNGFLTLRELIVAVFLLFFMATFVITITSHEEKEVFLNSFKSQFIYFSIVTSLLGILKFFLEVLFEIKFEFLVNQNLYPIGSSLKVDYNFFASGLLIGCIFILEKLIKKQASSYLNYLFLGINSLAIIMASSRRGLLLLFFIFLAVMVYFLFSDIKKFKSFVFFQIAFLITVTALIGIVIKMGTHGMLSFNSRYRIVYTYNDYLTFFVKNKNEEDTYRKLWNRNYRQDLKEVYNNELKRKNPPPLTFDKNPNYNHLENEPWTNFNSVLSAENSGKNPILRIEGFTYNSGVYKFIKSKSILPSFNISMNIATRGSDTGMVIHIKSRNKHFIYPVASGLNKGKWDNLQIHVPSPADTLAWIFIKSGGSGINQRNVVLIKNFSIASEQHQNNRLDSQFIHPEIIEPHKINYLPVNFLLDTLNWNSSLTYRKTYILDDKKIICVNPTEKEQFLSARICIPNSQFYEFSALVAVNGDNKIAGLKVQSRNYNTDSQKNIYLKSKNSWHKIATVFYGLKGDTVEIVAQVHTNINEEWALWKNFELKSINTETPGSMDFNNSGKVVPVDSIFSDAKQSKQKNLLFSQRTDRWIYAFALFNGYTFNQKIFGKGFDYLEKFRIKFYKPGHEFDYPHNVSLSTLLYSGISGLLIYLLTNLICVYYYIKQKKYALLAAFLVVAAFIQLSSNSAFELPIYAGLLFLPYLLEISVKSLSSNSNK